MLQNPQTQDGAKLPECNRGRGFIVCVSCRGCKRACCHSLPLDWADYAQVSAAAKKADYLCPNRVVSLETQDAIISMGRVIIGDQAHVTVRRWRGMRQSLTNEGFYMCEVNKVLPLNSRGLPVCVSPCPTPRRCCSRSFITVYAPSFDTLMYGERLRFDDL